MEIGSGNALGNVVISHYNKDIISTFVHKHTEKTLRQPFVPEIFPTECVVNYPEDRGEAKQP